MKTALCRTNLKQGAHIYVGLKSGIDFWDQVWKRVWKLKFWSEIGSGFRKPGGTPKQEFLPPDKGQTVGGRVQIWRIHHEYGSFSLAYVYIQVQSSWHKNATGRNLSYSTRHIAPHVLYWWVTVQSEADRINAQAFIKTNEYCLY